MKNQKTYTRENIKELKEQVLAVLCSDIHLSHKPPLARSAEPNWYKAMERQLFELSCLIGRFDCPVVYAGDIFDHWNSPPELINFALWHLPTGYAVPGQHDLPLHNPGDIGKSAYWTLVATDVLINLREGKLRNVNGLCMTGFPWGASLTTMKNKHPDSFHLAVVHKYCWTANHNPAKKEVGAVAAMMKQLDGFDAVVVGDNHSGFIANNKRLINCGTFFRRRTDERNYRPMVGLLLASGKIVPYYMDVSQDKFIEQAEKLEELQYSGFSEFVTELERLESDGLDFVDALTRAMKTTVSKEGRKLILEALEGAKG